MLNDNSIQLNSTFAVRDTSEYKDELGASVLAICQTMAGNAGGALGGPDLSGGVLVFFPSYGVMESAVERWNKTGMMDRLRTIGGGVIVEPRSSAGTPAATASNAGKPWSKKFSRNDSSEITVFGENSRFNPEKYGKKPTGGGNGSFGVNRGYKHILLLYSVFF